MSRHKKDEIVISVFYVIFFAVVFAFGYAMGAEDAATYAVERLK